MIVETISDEIVIRCDGVSYFISNKGTYIQIETRPEYVNGHYETKKFFVEDAPIGFDYTKLKRVATCSRIYLARERFPLKKPKPAKRSTK